MLYSHLNFVLANSTSSMPLIDNDFVVEYSVEEFDPKRGGRKPAVDYVIRCDVDGNTLFQKNN